MKRSYRRVGIVGLGTIATYYLHAIESSPDWDLTAVCDVRETALTRYRGTTRCFHDYHDMFRNADLDAVIVTVPNDVHATVCRTALRRKIPVCVEKPIAVSLSDGHELTRLSHTSGVPLFTAFHRRYNDNVRRLLADIHQHGEIESVRVRYLERIEEHIGTDTWYLLPRRCGGGCVADNGPNAFDLVRLLLGDIRVTGATVRRDRAGTDRHALIELRSSHGIPATVELDWSHPGETKDLTVRLTDGTWLRADMLAGHPGFKSSLCHEYAAILTEFSASITATDSASGGLESLKLVAETYRIERASTPVLEERPT